MASVVPKALSPLPCLGTNRVKRVCLIYLTADHWGNPFVGKRTPSTATVAVYITAVTKDIVDRGRIFPVSGISP